MPPFGKRKSLSFKKGKRYVGGETQRTFEAFILNMIRATHRLWDHLGPAQARSARYLHDRCPGERLDDATKLGGTETAIVLRKARREVEYPESALRRVEGRFQYVRVVQIALHARHAIWCSDPEVAAACFVKQGREDRFRIESR